MKPRTILIIAGVLGVLAVVLLQVESWRTRGGTKYVFRATKAVQPPAMLRGAVERVAVPATTYDTMVAQVPSIDLETWVTGTPTIRPIRSGETITFDMLQKSADSGLQITAGMRAVGIEIQAAQAVGYVIRPGDYVDMIGTIPEPTSGLIKTKQLLQARKVLAVGQQSRLEDSAFLQNKTYSTVTLEVTPLEAEQIDGWRGIVQNGFSLALRGRGDLAIVNTDEVSVYQASKAGKK